MATYNTTGIPADRKAWPLRSGKTIHVGRSMERLIRELAKMGGYAPSISSLCRRAPAGWRGEAGIGLTARSLDRLVRAGLVARRPVEVDRRGKPRRVEVLLTQEGREFLEFERLVAEP